MKYFYYKGLKFNIYNKSIDYKDGIISKISYGYKCDNEMYYILSYNDDFLIFESSFLYFTRYNFQKINRNINFMKLILMI